MNQKKILDLLILYGKFFVFFVLCFGNLSIYYSLKQKLIYIAARLGFYEFKHLKALKLLINQNDTVIDVGANFGIYTKALANIVKKGKVISFEPIPQLFDFLIKNCKTSNTEIYKLALSDKKTENNIFYIPLLFNKIPEPALSSLDKLNFKSLEIKVESECLDNFIDKIENLKFIKVDIEGHEFSFLDGAKNIINKFRPIIQIEDNLPVSNKEKYNYFCTQNSYQLFYLDNQLKFVEFDFKSNSEEYNFYLVPRELFF